MPDYAFNWQFTYEFAEPYHAPAGTVFEMVSHHDNSANILGEHLNGADAGI